MLNILTIDWEEWFHTRSIASVIPKQGWDTCESRIEKQTFFLLETLEKHKANATFFVVGSLAKNKPNLLKTISSAGHEIALHGMNHKMVKNMTPEEFQQDLQEGKKIISDILGKEIIGYRAPSWSITKKQASWCYDILKEKGFLYDSSDIFQRLTTESIKLIRPSSLNLPGFCLPFSGGIFFRSLPYPLIRHLIENNNKHNKNATLYFHPWEFDNQTPKLDLPHLKKIIHYYGKVNLKQKFYKLLEDFRFSSIEQAYFQNSAI
jgi:polysaccharide deacetylase family protein (PEP-CTERM system associated)